MRGWYHDFEAWMVRLIENKHAGRQEMLFPAIALFAMAGSGTLQALVFTWYFAAAGQDAFSFMFLVQSLFNAVFLFSLVRAWVSLELLVSTFILSNAIFAGSIAYADGGMDSPFLPWIFLAPLISFVLMGFRGFLIWATVSLGMLSLFVLQPQLFSLVPSREIPGRNLVSYVGLYASVMVAVALLGWVRRRTELARRELDRNMAQSQLREMARLAGEESERQRIVEYLRQELEPVLLAAEAERKKWRSEGESGNGPEGNLGQIRDEAERIVWGAHRMGNKGSLQDAIRNLAAELEQAAGLEVRLRLSEQVTLPLEAEHLHLFRIVQEATRNAARHAQATQLEIQLDIAQGQVRRLMIADNGQGFTMGQSRGHGLQNMRDRATFLGGRLQIDSVKDEGTQIRLSLPRMRQATARKEANP